VKINHIFLDMDGVIVDFVNGLCVWYALPCPYDDLSAAGEYDCFSLMGLGDGAKMRVMNNESFWRNLQFMPDGKAILKLVSESSASLVLLTDTGGYAHSASGKAGWVERHMPDVPIYMVFASVLGSVGQDTAKAKARFAAPDALLIDDSDKNVEAWQEAGGHAILVPRPWNSRHTLASYAIGIVEKELEGVGDA